MDGTMEVKRSPFQGVLNIIRFNWHFYFIATIIFVATFIFQNSFPEYARPWILGILVLAAMPMLVSLVVSFFIYDVSNLYTLTWVPPCNDKKVLNVNAGFDETSLILQSKFSNVDLTICDFYDEKKHTEISIKRARKAYPPHPETICITTNTLPFDKNTFDTTLAILAAHEVRDQKERIEFFKELGRVTKLDGQIYVTEHLRDFNNFLAYTIGFLHFHSKATWQETFTLADLTIINEVKTTPFITTFILKKNGDTP